MQERRTVEVKPETPSRVEADTDKGREGAADKLVDFFKLLNKWDEKKRHGDTGRDQDTGAPSIGHVDIT